jgi:hypothetical protein
MHHSLIIHQISVNLVLLIDPIILLLLINVFNHAQLPVCGIPQLLNANRLFVLLANPYLIIQVVSVLSVHQIPFGWQNKKNANKTRQL